MLLVSWWFSLPDLQPKTYRCDHGGWFVGNATATEFVDTHTTTTITITTTATTTFTTTTTTVYCELLLSTLPTRDDY